MRSSHEKNALVSICFKRARSLREVRKMCLAVTLLLLFGKAATAQDKKGPDQVLLVEGTPENLAIPASLNVNGTLRAPTGLSLSEAQSLLVTLLTPGSGTVMGATATCPLNPATYYVLHLVRHERGEPAARNDAWYAFTCSWMAPGARLQLNDPEIEDHYRQARLFGAKQLSMVYLHYGVPIIGEITAARVETFLREEWTRMLPAPTGEASVLSRELEFFWKDFELANSGLAWKPPAPPIPAFTAENYTQARNLSVTEVARLAADLAPKWVAEFRTGGARLSGPRGKKPIPLNNAQTAYVEEDFLPITYKIDVFRKAPVWQEDLRTITSQFGLQAGNFSAFRMPATTGALFHKSLDMSVNYSTSDIVITGIRGVSADVTTPAKVISTRTYDNERKYLFDLGFAIPFKSLRELKFDKDSKLVQVKPVEKNRIYATVGLFPLGSVNTKADRLYRLAPAVIYGMGLDKSPWNHHLIGVGLGLKWVQPFVGLAGNRAPLAATDGTIDSYEWSWRLTYGIQIPTRAITGAIKK